MEGSVSFLDSPFDFIQVMVGGEKEGSIIHIKGLVIDKIGALCFPVIAF
jgi:hypothetical protein